MGDSHESFKLRIIPLSNFSFLLKYFLFDILAVVKNNGQEDAGCIGNMIKIEQGLNFQR